MTHVDTTLAYLAGIVDGEGYIGIKKSKAYRCQDRKTPGYHARIQVRMNVRAAVGLLKDTFGGSFHRERENIGLTGMWCWSTSDKQAAAALAKLLPYLRVKRRQARNALVLRRLQARRQRHKTKVTGARNFPNKYGTPRSIAITTFSDEYVGWCEKIWMKGKSLNGR